MRTQRSYIYFLVLLCSACSNLKNDNETDNATDNATYDDTAQTQPESESIENDSGVQPPTIWSGPTITFKKENFADFELPENQDAVAENVVLTRGAKSGLFNIAVEDSHNNQSPGGTGWAEGTTAELDSLLFQPLKAAAGNQLKNLPGKSFVLHLIEDDVYIDVNFISWTPGSDSGGGFSYERATE